MSIEDLTDVVSRTWGGGRAAGPPRRGARAVLIHLAGFPGSTWQERWEASGLNAPGRRVGEIEGIDLTLRLLREKQATAQRVHANAASSGVVDLGMPSVVGAGTVGVV